MSPTPEIGRTSALTRRFASCQAARSGWWIATSETPDAELIERIATGDRLAMQALYTRHSTELYRFALRLLGDAAVAEDVLCDTFLDVWHQAWSFGGRLRVSTWLLGITRNEATRYSKLSPMHCELIDLAYYHRQSLDDVVAIMHLPRGTVKLQIHYARRGKGVPAEFSGIPIAPA